ncbi:MAG: hypothetical protein Q3993_07690, partial [Filifactor alocis]|nr:hypothetical protein [Filifactor alocis]
MKFAVAISIRSAFLIWEKGEIKTKCKPSRKSKEKHLPYFFSEGIDIKGSTTLLSKICGNIEVHILSRGENCVI